MYILMILLGLALAVFKMACRPYFKYVCGQVYRPTGKLLGNSGDDGQTRRHTPRTSLRGDYVSVPEDAGWL